jgi:hypothetical protein
MACGTKPHVGAGPAQLRWIFRHCYRDPYLLRDTELLAELDEHEGSVLSRYAGDLYGLGVETVARDPALRSSGTPSNRQNPGENIRAESGAKEC